MNEVSYHFNHFSQNRKALAVQSHTKFAIARAKRQSLKKNIGRVQN